MTYALFLGCTIPARSRNYELSARKVAEKLGVDLVDIPAFMCCGFPIRSSDSEAADVMAAYNLALAREKGLDLLTLCSSCTSALTEAAHHLAHDEGARDAVNGRLSALGLVYEGKTRVRHFARVLFEEVGEEAIKKHVTRDLGDLKVAVHYGCHYLKPSAVYDGFDEVEDPRTLDRLVAVAGAEPLDYPGKKRCCGGPVLPVDEKVAASVTREKLDEISRVGADIICLVCPFCAVMYDGNQKSIESEYETTYNLPVLYLPQLLGLAMGFGKKELGLNMNVVKTKKLLEKLGVA
ncbi:MAG: CoB--CoM heterodisulfide reductase iron-sulfur subunit B family protein [Deltaproteobacteria bacterium]|nr:CoB--CoM heterodisulfide reductase iron-sulfur subunit B family protein [Deltaproteobacteria bacterium]